LRGIAVIQADVDDPQTLLPAFRDAHVIFAVTDFWAPYFAAFDEKKMISDRATGEHAFDIEVQRGKNIVDAVDAVSQESGSKLERFVFSTLPGFKEQSNGKYTYVYHFDSKAVVTRYLKEKKELWGKSSLLNMGFYADNIIRYGGFMGAAKVGFSFPFLAPSFRLYFR
jgi:NmrA-like family